MDNSALVLSGAGPEETLCMIVAGDFSWTVSYRGQHVSPKNCSILRSAPVEVNTGKQSFLVRIVGVCVSISSSVKSQGGVDSNFRCCCVRRKL